MGTADVKVYNTTTSSWVDLTASHVEVSRNIATHGATFEISDAQIADRLLLIQGKEVQITLTQGSDLIRFKGFVERPKVIGDIPNSFNLLISCVGYEHGATTKWIGDRSYSSAEAYTAILIDLWTNYWPGIDRSKIVVNAKTLPAGETLEFQYKNLAQATNDLVARLDNYVWWIEWNGTTEYLRIEPRGYTLYVCGF